MRQSLIPLGIKTLIAVTLLLGAYFVVTKSNYYYLFIGNLLLLSGFAILTETFLYILFTLFKQLQKRKRAFISTSRSTFIVLFIGDLIIRLSGIMQTYPERADGNYFAIANHEKLDSWYWVHTPNTTISNQKKEFLFSRKVNSLGLSELEISKSKGSKFRILAIGDSFTEGVGTSYKKSWVKQMETRWKSKNVQSINAGVGGSDPLYSYALYRDKLIDYQPNIVILTINSSDITDISTRGGFERFHADGTAGHSAPSWEWVYATNHLFRLFIHGALGYTPSLVRGVKSDERMERSVDLIKKVISLLKNLTTKENSKLLIVLQPSFHELINGKHTPFFGEKGLENHMRSNKIEFINVAPTILNSKKEASEYYYPLDTHFNEKGYALFGNAVYEKVEELGFLD